MSKNIPAIQSSPAILASTNMELSVSLVGGRCIRFYSLLLNFTVFLTTAVA